MITKPCVSCGEMVIVHCTQAQLREWINGKLIQHAMPDVPKEEREMLLSGICGACWRISFAEQEEEAYE